MAAILLAAVGTWVLIQYVSNADERAIADQEVVEVLVVDRAIPEGTAAATAANSISTKLIPVGVRVPDALASLDSVRGLVTATDLLPGEQVVASRFVVASALVEIPAIEVPPGLLELTVAMTPERSVGGTLTPGQLVAVLASFDPFTLDAVEPEDSEDLNTFLSGEENIDTITLKTPNTTKITVFKALVTRVQVTSAPAETSEQQTADVAPAGTHLISLAISPNDAEKIVFAAEFGSLWMAREQADSPEDESIVITRANVYQ